MRLRDIITGYRNKLLVSDLTPDNAAKYLTELSSLLGNVNNQILDTDIAYNKKLMECYESEEKANRAKILAETSKEYRDSREAKNLKEVSIEMIRSLKFFLRSKEEEYKQSNN